MSLTIASNTQSLFAARAVSKNTMQLQRSVERMSTGLRINRAGDDAAGAAIADRMTAEIRGLRMAEQVAQDGISMAQTADAGISAIIEQMQRIRELYVQGSSGTMGTDEKDSIQREINERITVIGDIADTTKYNGSALLIGGTDKTLQTGAYNGETTVLDLGPDAAADGIDIDITATTGNGQLSEGAGIALDTLHISGATVDSQDTTFTGTGANGTLADIDTMIDNLGRMRGMLGAFSNALESKISFMSLHRESVTASRGRIRDLDVASESANLVKSQILNEAATAMLAQANTIPQSALNLIP